MNTTDFAAVSIHPLAKSKDGIRNRRQSLAVSLVIGCLFLLVVERAAWAQNRFAVARFNPWGTLDQSFGCAPMQPGCSGVPGARFLDLAGPNEVATRLILESRSKKPLAVGYATDNRGNRQFALAGFKPTDGEPDETFGTMGSVITTFPGFTSSYATSLAEDLHDPDHPKIVAVGVAWPSGCCADSRIALARHNPNGTLDTTFNGSGTVVIDLPSAFEFAAAVVMGPNGKITIAGAADGKLLVARYTDAGSLDSTFGCAAAASCAGFNITDLANSTEEIAYDLVLDRDNLVVAGKATVNRRGNLLMPGTPTNVFLIARYTGNGVLDTTFGALMFPGQPRVYSGYMTTDFTVNDVPAGSEDEFAHTLVVDSFGRYVAAGQVGAVIGGGNRRFALARYTRRGVLDTTFGCAATVNCTGKVVTDFPTSTDEVVYSLAVTNDNAKLLAAGHAVVNGAMQIALAQYNNDGILDTNFGCNIAPCGGTAITTVAPNQLLGSVAIDRVTASIVVAGSVQ
jgi:uncharacterized delta-60 repeat protein